MTCKLNTVDLTKTKNTDKNDMKNIKDLISNNSSIDANKFFITCGQRGGGSDNLDNVVSDYKYSNDIINIVKKALNKLKASGKNIDNNVQTKIAEQMEALLENEEELYEITQKIINASVISNVIGPYDGKNDDEIKDNNTFNELNAYNKLLNAKNAMDKIYKEILKALNDKMSIRDINININNEINDFKDIVNPQVSMFDSNTNKNTNIKLTEKQVEEGNKIIRFLDKLYKTIKLINNEISTEEDKKNKIIQYINSNKDTNIGGGFLNKIRVEPFERKTDRLTLDKMKDIDVYINTYQELLKKNYKLNNHMVKLTNILCTYGY